MDPAFAESRPRQHPPAPRWRGSVIVARQRRARESSFPAPISLQPPASFVRSYCPLVAPLRMPCMSTSCSSALVFVWE